MYNPYLNCGKFLSLVRFRVRYIVIVSGVVLYLPPQTLSMWLVGHFGPPYFLLPLACQPLKCSLVVIVNECSYSGSIVLSAIENFTLRDAWLAYQVSWKFWWPDWKDVFIFSRFSCVPLLLVGSGRAPFGIRFTKAIPASWRRFFALFFWYSRILSSIFSLLLLK